MTLIFINVGLIELFRNFNMVAGVKIVCFQNIQNAICEKSSLVYYQQKTDVLFYSFEHACNPKLFFDGTTEGANVGAKYAVRLTYRVYTPFPLKARVPSFS